MSAAVEYYLYFQEGYRAGIEPEPYLFTAAGDEKALEVLAHIVGTGNPLSAQQFYLFGGKELVRDGRKVFPTD